MKEVRQHLTIKQLQTIFKQNKLGLALFRYHNRAYFCLSERLMHLFSQGFSTMNLDKSRNYILNA